MLKQQTSFKYYLVMLFLNSFVDLGHKITIQNTVFKVYDGQQQIILIAIVNSLILLPYILLFTPAAYFSDRFALIKVMRVSAWIAVCCAMLITYFYFQGEYHAAFVMTLVLAIQSAIYSPAKYGYIKQLMGEAKLLTANARVQVATIVAILSGTLVFSILFEHMLANAGLSEANYSEPAILRAIAPLGCLLIISTLLELLMAYRLPDVQRPSTSKPKFVWKDHLNGRTLIRNLAEIKSNKTILYSIFGLSMFWSLSQMILAAFPAYAKQYLNETNTALIQAIIGCSGLGVLAGSVLVGMISRRTRNQKLAEHQLRLQLIPFGAIGFTLCLIILPFIDSKLGLALCFIGIGMFGAYFIVPLNAIIQSLAKPEKVGTILAGNNWVQNISMLSFLILTILSATLGANAAWLFALIALIAVTGTVYYLRWGLRAFMQFFLGGIFKLRYRISLQTQQAFPEKGAVMLLGNHVSWIDWALVQLAIPRTIRFVIDRAYYDHWLLHRFLKHIKTIPITPKRSKEAIKQINGALRDGDVVCLFPEGRISHDGELNEFKAGYSLALKETETQIFPFYISGLLGSRLSRVSQPRAGWGEILRLKRRAVSLKLGKSHTSIDPSELKQEVLNLRATVLETKGFDNL